MQKKFISCKREVCCLTLLNTESVLDNVWKHG